MWWHFLCNLIKYPPGSSRSTGCNNSIPLLPVLHGSGVPRSGHFMGLWGFMKSFWGYRRVDSVHIWQNVAFTNTASNHLSSSFGFLEYILHLTWTNDTFSSKDLGAWAVFTDHSTNVQLKDMCVSIYRFIVLLWNSHEISPWEWAMCWQVRTYITKCKHL